MKKQWLIPAAALVLALLSGTGLFLPAGGPLLLPAGPTEAFSSVEELALRLEELLLSAAAGEPDFEAQAALAEDCLRAAGTAPAHGPALSAAARLPGGVTQFSYLE